MDEGEGGLSFDFEGGLDAVPSHPTASNPIVQQPDSSANITAGAASTSTNANNPSAVLPVAPTDGGAVGGMGGNQRRSFRQTVCRHWLRSLCMKGDACGFLHQYDKSRMPVCRFFRLYGECREQDCVYKHTNEDIKECNMYKLGFCPNGPDCRYRHAKLPGPPPPIEEVLQKIQQLTSYNHGNANRFYQNRNPNFSQQAEKPQYQQIPNGANQVSKTTVTETPSIQQRLQQVTPSQPVASQAPPQNVSSGQQNQANRTSTPLPQGTTRYFIVKSCNRENLELSVQQGVWATQRSNEAKLNEAFESVENVILIFSVNRTRHFQGCAKMTSRIGGSNTGGSNAGGNWKHAHGTGHYGRNFSVKWLKLCELSFHKTRHLRNPYNENLPVKISRDCQELEASVGEQLASLLYLEPDSELMAVWVAAEAKREEEKEKGLSTDSRKENPDIVLFEDNEEEEEEESEEEDETFGQVFIPAAQGRGRGRGMMWPPFMPLAPGARPLPGMRGFPPNVMGGDGFPFGGVAAAPEGFPMPDLFSMGHRPFGPYGPRFSGDFAGPGPGMMFRGRPSQPGNFPPGGGFGMMMGPGPGPGRAPPPFMSGVGVGSGAQPRSVRPVGMPPMFPPPSSQPSQNSNRTKRDQKATTTTERNDRISSGSDQGKGQEITGLLGGAEDESRYQQQKAKTQGEDQFGSGNTFRNEESDSEDEAPRRSRHGEGKKKRRSSERDGTNNSSDQQTP